MSRPTKIEIFICTCCDKEYEEKDLVRTTRQGETYILSGFVCMGCLRCMEKVGVIIGLVNHIKSKLDERTNQIIDELIEEREGELQKYQHDKNGREQALLKLVQDKLKELNQPGEINK